MYIKEFNPRDEEYSSGDLVWITQRLIAEANKLESFDLPLAHIPTDYLPWSDISSLSTFMHHVKRVEEANLDYPIIMDCFGRVINGFHRVAKAILRGDKTVKAVRFFEPIPWDYKEKE